MSAVGRLAAFAVVLALAFGAAAVAGDVLDVRAGKASAEADGMGGHGGAGEKPADPVRGLAVADKGLTLDLARRSAPRGEQTELAFRITGEDGATVRDFDVEHTKRMHLIVVRRDLTGFQHLHPTQRADGSWAVPVTLADAGTYRVFADFAVDEEPHTLADDLTVDGATRAATLPAATDAVTVDGLEVALSEDAARAGSESELAFTVTRDGRPVEVAEYLGAKGHLVALRQGDLAFLHVHPDEDRLRFEATFPTAGAYRLFLQFKTADGQLHTAAFTQEVTR